MAYTVKDTGSERYLPPAGTYRAVCVDVVVLGERETRFGFKDQLDIVWALDDEHPAGGAARIQRRYTESLNEKSNLSRDLEAWRGKRFTHEERKGFDIEKLLGAPCLLSVVHNDSSGTTYANVGGLMPLPRGTEALAAPADYDRVIARDPSWDIRSKNYQDERGNRSDGTHRSDGGHQDGTHRNQARAGGDGNASQPIDPAEVFADDDLPF